MTREKTVDELMEEMERSAAALSNVPDPSETIGAGVEAAIAKRPKETVLPEMDFSAGGPVVLPEMDFSGGTDVAEQRSAAAPDVAKAPPAFSAPPPASARPDIRTTATAKAPPPRKGPLDWGELVERTKRGALVDDVVNSGNSMLAQMGPPGWQFKPNASDSSEKLARLPLEMAKEQQGMESRQLAGDAQRAKLEATAAAADPNSPQSQRAREAFKTFLGDTAPLPEGFDSWSAADVKSFADTGDLSLAERRKALTEEAKNRSKLSQLQLEALERERLRKAGLDEKKIEETMRHNKALEEAKKKTPKPMANIVAGDISTVPERRSGYRNLVKAIAEGKEDAPKAGGKFGAELLSDVLAFNPDFDRTKFGNYAAVSKATAGDQTITNAITAKKHFQRAMEHIPENFDAQSVNRIANYLKTGTGSDQLTQFETDVAIGAGELSKGLGENAEAGKELVRHLLSPNQSRAQLEARLKELVYLQDEALDTKRERFESAAPKGTALPAILKREGGAGGHGSKEPLKTRKTKSGETAYQSRTSGRWFTTPEEAEAN